MSGHWLLLNDIRVRADAQSDDPYAVARALAHLYLVPSLVEEEEHDNVQA
jgi:hypothetical protein